MGDAFEIGNDPLHLRIHEAGHAVIGRVLALKCYGVSVVADFDDESAGHAICITDPWMTIDHWDEIGIQHGRRDEDAAIRAGVLMLMAGCAAEQVILAASESPFADSEDEYAAITNLSSIYGPEEMQRYLDRLYRFALWLARRHRVTIERVGAALETKPALTGDEVDALILVETSPP